ncbi:unnamed protein product [Fasciola hepatica]|uniref:Uncharacterized protein n=1 Tax=Fasciola hepatica TaxID=6192 RepID=A0ABC9HI82_FASHE|nr:unnamed protein product [Fasciola hepatica]
MVAGLDTSADRQDAMQRFKSPLLGVGVDPLLHAVAFRSLLDRALSTLDEVSWADTLADPFGDSLAESLRKMVRVSRVGHSTDLLQIADMARDLFILDVPVVNMAPVDDSRMNIGFMEKTSAPRILNLEIRALDVERSE